MKAPVIIHAADIHYHPGDERRAKALASLDAICAEASERKADAVILAGDLFDGAVRAEDRDGFSELLVAIDAILEVAPIFVVYGTPTHDRAGCYDVFTRLEKGHAFTVVDPRFMYCLWSDGTVGTIDGVGAFEIAKGARLLVLGCPEPGKGWVLADEQGYSSDGARERMSELLGSIFLGLGARRRELPNVPAVMIYHGNVGGAVLQNGAPIPDSAFSVSTEQLDAVGADYYALGHIHKPQWLDGLPAYYPGSAYPIDWGELDRKTFHVVEFVSGDAAGIRPRGELARFPHRPRVKISAEVAFEADSGALIFDTELNIPRDCDVWLALEATKETASRIDHDLLLAYLQEAHGFGEGSRVTVATINTETVRAAEIQGIDTLEDKVRYWAECTSIERKDWVELIGKMRGLEVEASGSLTGAAAYRIVKLSLRGSTGVWKGIGLDEIEIDFDALDPGLVALLGPNGSGKSSLMENFHPFPTLLTRTGKLADHFRLRDSWRKLTVRNDLTNQEIRFEILIDGTGAAGTCEYFVVLDGEPIGDGRKARYEELVARYFGSLTLYVQSVFATQEPITIRVEGKPITSDIVKATDTELRRLCSELLGLHRYRLYSELARERARVLEADGMIDAGRIETLKSSISTGEADELELQHVLADVATIGNELKLAKEKEYGAADSLDAAEVALRLDNEKRDELRDEHERLNEAIRIRTDLAERRESAESSKAAVPEAREAETTDKRLTEEEAGLNEKWKAIEKARAQALESYNTQLEATRTRSENVGATITELEKSEISKRNALDNNDREIGAIEAELDTPVDNTCPTCKQALPEATRAELSDQRIRKYDELKELKTRREWLSEALEKLGESVKTAKDSRAAIEWPEEPGDDPELTRIVDRVTEIGDLRRELPDYRTTFLQAAAADATIAELDKQLQETAGRISQLEERVLELGKELEPEDEARIRKETAEDNHAEAVRARERKERELKGSETKAAELRGKISQLEDNRRTLAETVLKVEKDKASAGQWRFLETAVGEKGVQALELDAAAPAISAEANRLLEATYGPRFAIRFETTKDVGKGSDRHVAEAFAIYVLDNNDGEEQPIGTLSGGQAVWIRKALSDAFAVIRKRTTGLEFLSVCQDEADGALDSDKRELFFRMLENGHAETGRRHTVVVTHSPEAQGRIGQSINMLELVEQGSKE